MQDRPRRVRLWLAAGLVTVIMLALALFRLVGVSDASVLRTVTVGLHPGLAVVDAPRGRIFVANTNDGTVSVLDTRDGRLLHTTPVGLQIGSNVYNAAADASSGRVFFRTGDDVVSMLDALSGKVVWTTALPSCSRSLAVDTRLAHLFTAECQNGTVQMIDARGGRILATIQVGGQPQEIAIDELTGRVFVLDGAPSSGGRISILDAASGRVLRTVTLGGDLCLCITTPLPGGSVFVFDGQKSQVYVLDASSARVVRTVKIGMDIYAYVINPRTGQVILVGTPPGAGGGVDPYRGPGRLAMLDGRSGRVVRRLDLSAPPSDVAMDASGRRLLLAFIGRTDAKTDAPVGAGYVEVRDAHSLRVLCVIPAGIVPSQIAVDPRTDHAFVINTNVVPGSSDPTGNFPTYLPRPEGWWQATMRRVQHLLPWLPLHVPPRSVSVNGTITVVDLARVGQG